MARPPLCLIGQAIVDVSLPQHGRPYKMRLGGILHAARALWAAEIPYVLAFAAPDYLTDQVEEYAKSHGALACSQFGKIFGSPNVVLIGEVKETGEQGYEYLLREEHKCDTDLAAISTLIKAQHCEDALVISGGFHLTEVLEGLAHLQVRSHVDLAGSTEDWDALQSSKICLETLSLSTSSPAFHHQFQGSPSLYWEYVLPARARAALLKENRGGSRLRTDDSAITISTPAFLGTTEHSVGVGDCFDAIWIALRRDKGDKDALAYASFVAADYASTTFPNEFRDMARASLKLNPDEVNGAVGVVLSWEQRPLVQIYIAAPDFDYVDRRPIDAIAAALRYHNLTPRLPIRENGQAGVAATVGRMAELLASDLQMLGECQLMIAVLTYNDPGTLIEIGIACERTIPVAVYDPGDHAQNLVLTELPNLVTSDMEQIISWAFEQAGRLKKDLT